MSMYETLTVVAGRVRETGEALYRDFATNTVNDYNAINPAPCIIVCAVNKSEE